MRRATIHMVFGPIGAGKTTKANELGERHHGIVLSADQWFRELYLDDATSDKSLDWSLARLNRCEKQILHVAEQLANSGCDVILDLGLTKRQDRQRLRTYCEHRDFPFRFYYLEVARAVRWSRVQQRNELRGDTFVIPVSESLFTMIDQGFENPDHAELTWLSGDQVN